ncbi:hypothetical protein llap_14730 [Limosa lapponica baueri]|uniref:Uncharacterized protein n=1 Tax=Limosa lapponica baueri TaxID=1758121 RepID=A0A2I0TMD5_LIMLA|nr:hypothetical protein llap_14730 [Limosa lapponica baueri]
MDNVMSEMLGQKPQGPRNNTWPNRDQTDGVFGMLGEILPFDPAGPDLVAAVKQRRKHSSGEQEPSTLPSPPLLSAAEDRNQDNKTKTWPPKAPWQHTSSVPSTLPGQSSSLYPLGSPASQWGDTMPMLQSPVWAAATDCAPAAGMSPGFAYAQQQQPQQQPSQHKHINKGFKAFPVKHERRPSYLHQY